MIWVLIFFILYSLIVTNCMVYWYRKCPKETIYNLFYEINSRGELRKYDYGYTYYYRGVVKTLYPSGKEEIIWISEKEYTDKSKCEEDTKLRYKFLCDYYGQKYEEEKK